MFCKSLNRRRCARERAVDDCASGGEDIRLLQGTKVNEDVVVTTRICINIYGGRREEEKRHDEVVCMHATATQGDTAQQIRKETEFSYFDFDLVFHRKMEWKRSCNWHAPSAPS